MNTTTRSLDPHLRGKSPLDDIHLDHLKLTLDNSIAESHEDDQNAKDSTHVDEDATSQPHADEEPFHQLSTHESMDAESIDSIHENLAQCDMILAAYQGEYDQLERTSTHTSDLCDTLGEYPPWPQHSTCTLPNVLQILTTPMLALSLNNPNSPRRWRPLSRGRRPRLTGEIPTSAPTLFDR